MNSPERTLVYLATPYGHPDEKVREQRVRDVNLVAGALMCQGIHVFSPVSHLYPISKAGKLPEDWAYWQSYCRAMLGVCGKLVVLMQDGWKESTGVQGEIKIAEELGIPIEFIEHDLHEKPDVKPQGRVGVVIQVWTKVWEETAEGGVERLPKQSCPCLVSDGKTVKVAFYDAEKEEFVADGDSLQVEMFSPLPDVSEIEWVGE